MDKRTVVGIAKRYKRAVVNAIGAAKGIAKNALVIVVCSVGGPGSVIAAAARSALAPAIAGSAEAALLYGAAQL